MGGWPIFFPWTNLALMRLPPKNLEEDDLNRIFLLFCWSRWRNSLRLVAIETLELSFGILFLLLPSLLCLFFFWRVGLPCPLSLLVGTRLLVVCLFFVALLS